MDIEFGKLQQSTPQPGLRPDEDGQLVVATVGSPHPNELAIFVDLDVMRDMEAHALSNTRVELGGVMLGYQRVDRAGVPFVVVNDCLRAEHYQATKGSFKFTHETWSQITRDRARFKPELEMVGWYHTHPGWSVFLSGMDLFICDHFFNRPLDIALVIDPCKDDRGWFYWGSSAEPAEQALPEVAETVEEEKLAPLRAGGFYLTSGRFRSEELQHFANQYNRSGNRDPRDPTSFTDHSGRGPVMVNLTDQRRPLFEIALGTMMFAQFLLLALLGWRLTANPSPSVAESKEVLELRDQVDQLKGQQRSQIERQAQRDVLQMLVNAQNGQPDFVEKYAELKTGLDEMKSNLSAQIALSEQLKQAQQAVSLQLDEKNKLNERLSIQLRTAHEELSATRQRNEQLAAQLRKGDPQVQPTLTSRLTNFELPWWATIASALAVLGVGIGAGFLFGRTPALGGRSIGKFPEEPGSSRS